MEKMSFEKNGYKAYISGLKGFACLMVMIGHFIGLYKYALVFPVKTELLDLFNKFITSKIGFVLDENFWVVLFFFVSGYLVANSSVNSLKEVVSKSVLRILRLGVPILFVYIIIFCIYKLIGFYNAETTGVFVNEFIQGDYLREYSFFDFLKGPVDVLFFKKISLNSPYWVLREMLSTSVLIYFFGWLKNKVSNKNIFFIVLFVGLVLSLVKSNIVFAGLLGMVLCYLEKEENKFFWSNRIFVLTIVVFSALLYFIPRSRISSVFFGALVALIPKLHFIEKVFSSKIAAFLGKISFGIYSFHWPIFCSVGLKTFLNTYGNAGLVSAWLLASLVSIIVTILISVVFYYAIEKHIYAILKKLKTGGKKRYE